MTETEVLTRLREVWNGEKNNKSADPKYATIQGIKNQIAAQGIPCRVYAMMPATQNQNLIELFAFDVNE